MDSDIPALNAVMLMMDGGVLLWKGTVKCT